MKNQATNMWPADSSRSLILEQNVAELQAQLQQAYQKIKELQDIIANITSGQTTFSNQPDK